MATYILYGGTRSEKRVPNSRHWQEQDWQDDMLTLTNERDGVQWVNGASNVRGLGYRPAERRLVGRPTQGRSPQAWLCETEDGALWICVENARHDFMRLRVEAPKQGEAS